MSLRIHECIKFLLLNRDLIQRILFASFKCFRWNLNLSQERWKWFMIQSLLSDPIWWTWLDDSAVETPITRNKKMDPKSSDFKEAGGSLTLGNLFLADDIWLCWYNVVLYLTCAQMFLLTLILDSMIHTHSWYLSFFLHGQNFWKIKCTPKLTQ